MRKSTGRPRDSRGRLICSSKFPATFGLVDIPLINVFNQYARLRKEGASLDTNLVLDREFLDPGEKTIQ